MFGKRARPILKSFGKKDESIRWKGGGKSGRVISFDVRGPADVKLSAYSDSSGTFLFEDGSIGEIVDVDDFDPCDFYEDEDFDEDEYWDAIDKKRVKEGSDLLVGSLYTDRFDRNGGFHQGSNYAYTEGKLLRDQLDEDRTPYPVRSIPEIFYEMGDYGRNAKRVYKVLDLYLAGEIDEYRAAEMLSGRSEILQRGGVPSPAYAMAVPSVHA